MSKEKSGLAARIGRLLAGAALPVRASGSYRVEVEGKGEGARVLVSGADAILLCTEERVVLRASARSLRFEGEGLSCLTYEGGIAEIEGRISGFFLEENG